MSLLTHLKVWTNFQGPIVTLLKVFSEKVFWFANSRISFKQNSVLGITNEPTKLFEVLRLSPQQIASPCFGSSFKCITSRAASKWHLPFNQTENIGRKSLLVIFIIPIKYSLRIYLRHYVASSCTGSRWTELVSEQEIVKELFKWKIKIKNQSWPP